MLRECEHKTTEEPTPTPFDAVPREFLYIKETYIDFDPYYTIVYKAHGVEYEGFGSFSISNISTYLRLYFIPQIEDKKRTSCSENPNSSKQPDIIHCKDCVNYHYDTKEQGERFVCGLDGFIWKPEDYCSYAERKTADDNDEID